MRLENEEEDASQLFVVPPRIISDYRAIHAELNHCIENSHKTSLESLKLSKKTTLLNMALYGLIVALNFAQHVAEHLSLLLPWCLMASWVGLLIFDINLIRKANSVEKRIMDNLFRTCPCD